MNVQVMVRLGGSATTVARFNANTDRVNLNCNRNLQNSKSQGDENPAFGITQVCQKDILMMKTYRNLYGKLCSLDNPERAFRKARKRKAKQRCVKKFEENLEKELLTLKRELETFSYNPQPLKRFIIRAPKTRTIHASAFRDKVVHHALVNVIEPIFEPIFIVDSYANRKNKGTLKAVLKFDEFKRKISKKYSRKTQYFLFWKNNKRASDRKCKRLVWLCAVGKYLQV